IGMLAYADELNEEEKELWLKFKYWLIELEKTGMTKSYKMVVLSYMLSKGPGYWLDPVTSEETAPFFHHYLTEKDYRLNTDFNDVQGKKLRKYNEKNVAKLISTMPMTKWSGSTANGLITFLNNEFK